MARIPIQTDRVLRLPRRGPTEYMPSMARASTDPTILRVAQREIPLLVSRNKRARRITLRLDSLSRDAWEKIAVDRGAPPEEVERDLATLCGSEPAPTNGKPEEAKDASPNPAHIARSKWMS